ncbi:unnamed protein product [Owenia fusiformis]|uniref:Uncharacterized protein n=1 Tax=Owenia fusiformis TaxID=6347 RepID=A0A8J1XY69_OWEFU|nr:unnamed protein product [Owenia fusiformis]
MSTYFTIVVLLLLQLCGRIDSTKEERLESLVKRQGEPGCVDWNGIFRPENSTWMEGCVEYSCYQGGSYGPSKLGCRRNTDGVCVDIGAQWYDGCIGYECFQDGGSFGTRVFKKACSDGAGGCKDVNATWVNDQCTTYQCFEEGNYLVSRVVNQECRTCSGSCVPLGSEGFCYIIGGNTYQNCRCFQDGNYIRYQCSGFYGYQDNQEIRTRMNV